MDLRSKLALYKTAVSCKNGGSINEDVANTNVFFENVQNTSLTHELSDDLCKGLNGKTYKNGYGSYYLIEKKYPLSEGYGCYSLKEALDIKPSLIYKISSFTGCNNFSKNKDFKKKDGFVQRNLFEQFELGSTSLCKREESGDKNSKDDMIKQMLFIDTETTGLSCGTGTVAFLIGLGYFEKAGFVLKQFFMRDYDEETAVLYEISNIIKNYRVVVSFNGKAYDWNLLQSRFAFNRIEASMDDFIHIDLLYPSRRIWRLKLENCRLSSIEENILGEVRTDDIPGAMIPSVYFKYLETRDTRDIKRVIDHNCRDILCMVSLLVKICRMLENPLAETDGCTELLGIGTIFEKQALYEKKYLLRGQVTADEKQGDGISGKETPAESSNAQMLINCFSGCTKSQNSYVKESASRKLAEFYKKNGMYKEAVKQWEAMLQSKTSFKLYPLLELAKYYEHRAKDIPKAIDIVEQAIRETGKLGYKNNIYFDDLKKRLERLKRKNEKRAYKTFG